MAKGKEDSKAVERVIDGKQPFIGWIKNRLKFMIQEVV